MTLDVLIAWLCWVTFALSLWVILDEIARCLPARDPVRERREHEERLAFGRARRGVETEEER